MRNTSVMVLVAALVMAGIAAILVHNWLQAQPRTGTVVVASKGLSFGAELSNDNLATIEWPAGQLPNGAFATKASLLKGGSRVVLTPIERNEPILATKISGAGQRGTLSALLEGDMRAVTVGVDVVRGVGGFVLPGDRVDVVLIRTHGEGGDSYADVIVQNVKVLAVDQQANERAGGKAAIVARAVTLAVSPEDAQKILLATNIGKLSLTLRQPGRQGEEAMRRITERDLTVASAPPPRAQAKVVASAAPVAAPPPVARNATVVIFHGMKSQQYTVSQEGM